MSASDNPGNPRRQSIVPPTIKKYYSDFIDHADEGRANRYKIGDLLGKGAFGQIYSAFDRNIGRRIAIKSPLPDAMQDKEKLNFFLHEAQLTASLQHPNIIPIYDLDTDSDGRPYFTMREIEGTSLGTAIDRAAAGNIPPEIRSYSNRINIMLKVMDAISYVHSCGIVHQDIKPDNIMLGKFGEVMVSDWGTACFISEFPEGRLIGTPLFMPPEQAQRHPISIANDIYALGATLYNLLTWQYPMDDQDSNRFWEKKFSGYFDKLPPEIARDVPSVLLDIAHKAMQVDARKRYASVDLMARDLRSYLEGAIVSAHSYSVKEIISRSFRRNRRHFTGICLTLLLIAGLSFLWINEKMRETSDWRTLATISLDQDGNRQLAVDWKEFRGVPYGAPLEEIEAGGTRSAWHIRDGVLYGAVASDDELDGRHDRFISNLTWRHNIIGGMRIEFTLTPLAIPTGLKCFIAGSHRHNSYLFHIGDQNNPAACVLTKGENTTRLAEKNLEKPLKHLSEHRIGMEYHSGHVRLYIDGQPIIDYFDTNYLSGPQHQTFGFEAGGNLYSLRELRVFQKPAAEKISPLGIPDTLMQTGNYEQAIDYYRELLRHYPHADYATLAKFRIASCHEQSGKIETAREVYREIIADAPARDPVRLNTLVANAKIALRKKDLSEWEDIIGKIAIDFPGAAAAQQLVNDYSLYLFRKNRIQDDDAPDLPGRVRNCLREIQLLHHHLGYGNNSASVDYEPYVSSLLRAGYPEYVAKYWAWHRGYRQQAQCQMGEYRSIAARPDSRNYLTAADALLHCGAITRAIREFPYYTPAYIAAEDFTTAAQYIHSRKAHFALLISRGELSEAKDIARLPGEVFTVDTLLHPDAFLPAAPAEDAKKLSDNPDKLETWLAAGAVNWHQAPYAISNALWQAIKNNDKKGLAEAAAALAKALPDMPPSAFGDKRHSPEFLGIAISLGQLALDDREAAKKTLDVLRNACGETPFRYNYLLPLCEYLLGNLDEKQLAARANVIMPWQQKSLQLLASAWRADLREDTATARKNYDAWQKIPPHRQVRDYPHLPYLRLIARIHSQR